MGNVERLEDEDAALGLQVGEIQWVARRQLVGSLFVAALIAVAASLMAFRPAHHDTVDIAPHKLAGIQQPSFLTPPGARVAGIRRPGIELP